jgi:predicted membrane protein
MTTKKMRLSSPLLSLLINFLLGASWAFALIGASTLFFSFLSIGIIYALLGSLIGALPGLFMVLLIEYFLMREEKLQELKKQTKLLEQLVAQKNA